MAMIIKVREAARPASKCEVARDVKTMPRPTGDAALIYKALTGAMPGEKPLFPGEAGVLPLEDGSFVAAVEKTDEDVSWFDYCDNYGTDSKGRTLELGDEDHLEAVALAKAASLQFIKLYPPRQFMYGVFKFGDDGESSMPKNMPKATCLKIRDAVSGAIQSLLKEEGIEAEIASDADSVFFRVNKGSKRDLVATIYNNTGWPVKAAYRPSVFTDSEWPKSWLPVIVDAAKRCGALTYLAKDQSLLFVTDPRYLSGKAVVGPVRA